MALIDVLKKNNIPPEVIAAWGAELITEDEILQDGEVIKLVGIISVG